MSLARRSLATTHFAVPNNSDRASGQAGQAAGRELQFIISAESGCGVWSRSTARIPALFSMQLNARCMTSNVSHAG